MSIKIGCHVSIAGSITNAPQRAAEVGCEVFQMFSRSPQGGPAPKINQKVATEFKKEMKKHGQAECYIHTPYYINFCSGKESTRKASARIVREELERGNKIGAKYVMTHLGSAKDMGQKKALEITRNGIKEVLKGYKGKTELLLEISAGSGNIIGDKFEELAFIMKGQKAGICLDSAHMFASGYDIKTKSGFKNVIKQIEATVGKNSIKLIHANDSKVGLGERKDRHDHIGDGKIGLEGFKNLANYFKNINFVLETRPDKIKKDIIILKSIR